MRYTISISVIMVLLTNSTVCRGQSSDGVAVSSPDGHTRFETKIRNAELMYHVLSSDKEVITWSGLGFVINNIDVGKDAIIKKHRQRQNREIFAWPLGENDTISNNYNEIIVTCAVNSFQYRLIARAYNGSIAFRYEITDSVATNNTINKEMTSFNFSGPVTLYQYNQESVFTPTNLDTLHKTCDFPATLINGQSFISIGEANNDNYTKAELRKAVKTNGLSIGFTRDSSVRVTGSFHSPWRTISIAESSIGLCQFSQLNLKLNPPPKHFPVGIKPGKLIRAQLNTQSGLDCINFAAKHNFQYIMFDAGWYGAEFRTSSDPTQVIPQIDMPQVIRKAKEQNIGVILYVNYVGLRAKLDTILPLFKQWGIAGLKFGFVDGLSQNGIEWVAHAIKKATDNGFILDIHDNYKPTGLSRTYPALLTQEGVRGDENSPDAFHTMVLPFTRFLAGPADFTFCYPNATNSFSKNLKVSMAQQMALTVIYFSPLQSIFWYGQPNDYTNEDEIAFFKYVPTVWNESHYLAGEIGKNISVARRSGKKWFMGNAAGLVDWKTSVPIDFLSRGVKYKATIYEDGKGSVIKNTMEFKKGDSFKILIPAKEGQAIIFEPVE